MQAIAKLCFIGLIKSYCHLTLTLAWCFSQTLIIVLHLNYFLTQFHLSIILLVHSIHVACCVSWHPIKYHVMSALILASMTATLSIKSDNIILFPSCPALCTSATIVSDHAPRVSMGRGQNTIPTSVHASPCLNIFVSLGLSKSKPRDCFRLANECRL